MSLSVLSCLVNFIWFHTVLASGRSGWPDIWLTPGFIHTHCFWLIQSFPDLPDEKRTFMLLECKSRYKEIVASNNYSASRSCGSTDKNLCVLDLDQTLIAHAPANIHEKHWLRRHIWKINNESEPIAFHSFGGIIILRQALDLIETLHEISTDVVIYSLGVPPHVVLSMICMEFAYSEYYKGYLVVNKKKPFRFTGLMCNPFLRRKSFGVVQWFGYRIREYHHVLVVDDQHRNVWLQDDALRTEGKILKLSDNYRFGDFYKLDRKTMSVKQLVDSICWERKNHRPAYEWLVVVEDTWTFIHNIDDRDWEHILRRWYHAGHLIQMKTNIARYRNRGGHSNLLLK